MSFCPECGKPATADATSCASCGYAFEAKPAAGKQGAARFKGTMLMAPSPLAKPATQAAAAAVPAPARGGAAPSAAAAPQAPAASPKAAPKMTMIGTGVNVPAGPDAAPQPAADTKPVVQAAPIAAKAPAIAAPIAQAAPVAQVPDPAPVAPAARVVSAAKPAAQPPLSLSLSLDRTADPLANTDPPEALSGAGEDTDSVQAREPKYLPGDPMAPQPTAARAPMLRYDDSRPSAPRGMDQDKRWLWIAAGVIVIACLGLVIVIASRMH